MPERRELEIARIGAQGDGVAETVHGAVFVPLSLPGERIVADVEGDRGRLVQVLAPSADRVAPPCPHFGTCGGCSLQHVREGAYLDWKRAQVAAAFHARGIEAEVAPVVPSSGKRRRAALAAVRRGGAIALGFHGPGSHDVVALETCTVLHRKIVAAFSTLAALTQCVVSKKGETRVVVTWTDAGLDVVLDDVNSKLTADVRAAIAEIASAGQIARVSVNRDPVYEALLPELSFGEAKLVPPPGSFLQAVAEAEAEMAKRIILGVGKAKSVADLFCGLGAFTFRLAKSARVLAIDSDKPAIETLKAAAKTARGLKPIEARLRDLFREPLSATELNAFDAVVFDPPRAGADAQAKMIAKSKVKTIVAISCNPATLARDARTLLDGGYAIESLTPIDQFHYSPHVEVVAVFKR